MINLTIKKSQFPDDAKMAVFAPLHYKNSCLDKENFRLVSILPILSKLYEKALNAQLTEYSNHLDIFRSAFRTQYGCQSTLLRVIEDWKQALDQNKYVAAILMDLFKAFDCLSHDLLLLKLKGIYHCPIEIIKGLTDKGQFQYLTKLKGPQVGIYL